MPDISGNLSGVRESVIEKLKTLYDEEIGGSEFLPPDFAVRLAAFSAALNREIAVYVSRSGEVLNVSVGYVSNVQLDQLSLRRSDRRLSMVRCIHTHPGGSAELSDVDLTALKSLRLDAMCAIGVRADGSVAGVSAAFLGEGMEPKATPVLSLDRLPQEEWLEEIAQSDRLTTAGGSSDTAQRQERALLVSIDSERSLDELAALCDSAGAVVVGRSLQQKPKPDPATYVGSGKAADLSLDAQALEADILVADDELSAVQTARLEELVGIPVVDRTTLILDIFARNAVTSEGKLQVELAQLNYRASHLKGQGQAMSRLLGGIGVRGPGESKLEMDRRHIRERIGQLKEELDRMERQRGIRRKGRQRAGTPVVALVGYTNVGKSTLLNRLTGAGVLVKDQLFATLDAVNRRLELPVGDGFILVDTVGFINKLPTDLVEAFHSTLEEAALADVLLIVSDASSPEMAAQRAVVEEVLDRLGANRQPRIEVLNKCDLAGPEALQALPGAFAVSAADGTGLDELIAHIAKLLRERERLYRLFVPFADYALLGELRRQGRLLGEEHLEEGTLVSVMLDRAAFGRLEARLGKRLESMLREAGGEA